MATGLLPARRPLSRRVLRQAIRVLNVAATPYGVDRYVELVRPSWSSTELRAKVERVARTTPRSVTLTLRPNGNWTGFRAGQYTQLSVEVNGVRHTRCYSMTNDATARDGLIELSITAQPDGLVGRHLRQAAQKGQTVSLTTAMGSFTLPSFEPAHLFFISGGSGITPVMSMLRTRCALGWSTPVTFLHYALNEQDMLYREDLEEMARTATNVRVVRVFTDRPGTGDLDGFLTAAHLDRACPEWTSAEAFVCGPAALMESASTLFAQAGRSEHLQTEAFTLPQFTASPEAWAGAGAGAGAWAGAGARIDGAGEHGTVRFGASEIGVVGDGTPVLLQAEAVGLAPLTGCRMGICHTCTRRLCSGVVRDAVTGEITTGPNANIRICVSVPVGDVEIDL